MPFPAPVRVRRASSPAPPERGFTLLEVLFCMAVFAIGFAAIALIMPAGMAMQKEVETNIDGALVARNAMEVVKAKGMNAAYFLYYNYGRCSDVRGITEKGDAFRKIPALWNGYTSNSPVYAYGWSGTATPQTCWDLEGAMYSWELARGGQTMSSWVDNGTGVQRLVPYFNTNADGALWQDFYAERPASTACYARSPWGRTAVPSASNLNSNDLTNLPKGQIHCFKNRRVPGFNYGEYSLLDLSYPSSVFDVKGRTYVALGTASNTSDSYDDRLDDYPDLGCQDAAAASWRVMFFALRRNDGDEWPEFGDGNVGTTGYLFANNAFQMRSIGSPGNVPANAWDHCGLRYPASSGVYGLGGGSNSSFNREWPYTSYGPGSSLYSPPATGGDPTHPDPRFRAGALGGAAQNGPAAGWNPIGRGWFVASGGTYNGPYGSGRYGGMFPYSVAVAPDRDAAFGGGDYQGYPLPGLVRPYAMVYDRDSDLLILRYPAVYGKGPAPDARLSDFWSRHPDLDPQQQRWRDLDRKLKVGDRFVASPGSYTFQVREVLDIVSEKARVEAKLANGEVLDWTDGTYQIVRVTPRLRDTPYSGNVMAYAYSALNTERIHPPMYQAVVAVPPRGGQTNPCTWIENVRANDVIVRPLDNLAE